MRTFRQSLRRFMLLVAAIAVAADFAHTARKQPNTSTACSSAPSDHHPSTRSFRSPAELRASRRWHLRRAKRSRSGRRLQRRRQSIPTRPPAAQLLLPTLVLQHLGRRRTTAPRLRPARLRTARLPRRPRRARVLAHHAAAAPARGRRRHGRHPRHVSQLVPHPRRQHLVPHARLRAADGARRLRADRRAPTPSSPTRSPSRKSRGRTST